MCFSGTYKGFFGAVLAAALVVSCATKSDVGTTEEALKVDESASDQVPSSESEDISIFADLKEEQTPAVSAGTESLEAMDDQPFYSAVGGETLGRVAYALYSDRSKAAHLKSLNSEVEAGATLVLGQRVRFDFDGLRPQPMFLTKDLIERYPDQLAQALSGGDQDTVEVQAGETLQMISQRLYGTTRYWTEIYLLNKERLGSFDKVSAGIQISVVKRAPVGVVSNEAQEIPVVREEEEVIPAPAPQQISEEKLAADVLDTKGPEVALEPKVETPKVEAPVVPPPAVKEPSVLKTEPEQQEDGFWNSTNLRRVIYVGLILIIVVFAFYVTRPSKKQKFDMLDMTSSHLDGGDRPKLSKGNHDRNIVG